MSKEITHITQHQRLIAESLREFDRICRELQIPYVLFAGTLLGAVRHRGFVPWDDDLDVMMLREDYERFLREADGLLDTERFFLQKEFSEHWPMFFSKLRLNNTACIEKYHPKDAKTHQGVYMDIFPCDHALDSAIGRKLQFLASKVVIAKSLDRRGYDTDSKLKRLFMGFCRMIPLGPVLKLTKAGKADSKMVHGFLGGAHGFRKSVFERRWFTERTTGEFEGRQYPIPADYDSLLKQLYGDYTRIPTEEERQVKQHALLVDLEHSWEEYEHYRDELSFETYTRSIR